MPPRATNKATPAPAEPAPEAPAEQAPEPSDEFTLSAELPPLPDDAGLFTRLAWIAGGIPRIPKRGRHPQGWKFARVEDYADLVRIRMGMAGVVALPHSMVIERTDTGTTTSNHNTIWHYECVVQWELGCDTSRGRDTYLVPSEGEADDHSDKGRNKAITAARKNLMLTVYHLAAGDDPDAHDSTGGDDGKGPRQRRQNGNQGAAQQRSGSTIPPEDLERANKRLAATQAALAAVGVPDWEAWLTERKCTAPEHLLQPAKWGTVSDDIKALQAKAEQDKAAEGDTVPADPDLAARETQADLAADMAGDVPGHEGAPIEPAPASSDDQAKADARLSRLAAHLGLTVDVAAEVLPDAHQVSAADLADDDTWARIVAAESIQETSE